MRYWEGERLETGVRTVRYTFVLDFQVFVGSGTGVGKYVRSGHDSTLGPVVTSEKTGEVM